MILFISFIEMIVSVEEVQRKDKKYVSANNLLVEHNDFAIPKLEITPIVS